MDEQNTENILEFARRAVAIADGLQASEIVLLDLRNISSFVDFFVVLSAETRRQLNAIADDMDVELTKSGVSLHHREGNAESGWILLDFGDLIVHLFGAEERSYYRLDHAWSHAPELVRIQ
jgi:ribosome-associated protein